MKVAAIQHDIVWEDAERTRKNVAPLIAQAAASGARLIVLTEMFATGFSMQPERIAEYPGGANEQFLVDQAREHGSYLVGSIAQWDRADGRARNVAVLAQPPARYTATRRSTRSVTSARTSTTRPAPNSSRSTWWPTTSRSG